MISIIICSRGQSFRQSTIESVAGSIGVPYEVIAIDNSKNEYGICEAYNIGATRAQYGILCFMHEDIAFRTTGWGNIVERILLDNSIGVLGITGGKWLPNAPGTWWSCGNKYLSSNVLDQSSNGEYSRYTYSNPEDKNLVDVAAVDGLWICARKEVWARFPFDEKVFPGFHFYDVDFCATISQEYRICVSLEISVTHFSLGSYNDSWLTYADVFYRKHLNRLPIGQVQLSNREACVQEYEACKTFLLQLIDKNMAVGIGYLYLSRCIKMKPFSRDTIWLARYYARYIWQNRYKRKHKG
ncbi:hypothetical protein FNT36_18875 [Hymenobacter setariae]|uniref:Streptomycin biosynthesis protein StrF domain-containing protein n=1 Tax=Hymenobacter setariae TaxID=2594794 RepID=A0A558BP25_9BACT|nr:glycosyltransferase [Hymenobacter setariae]TVT38264.1 hypothetical protein FNT36_18875 [Hymenobacter setariae]